MPVLDNARHERFIQNIVKGMSQREAYKEVFNADYDDNAIDVNASKLFNDTKVQLRYKELMQELEDKSIMSAKERMKWLSDVIRDIQRDEIYVKNNEGDEVLMGSKNADINTKIKALDTLNKMSGEYITKIAADVNSDVNINIELTDE
jgi:phage terminase small subunit